MDELVIDGKTGFLVDPNDQELWAKKIIELLLNTDKSEQMGQAAYQFATGKFGIPYQIAQVCKIYESL